MANPIMVKAWFRKSIEDYNSAKDLFNVGNDDHLKNCSFLIQQSIEKSIKGFLLYNKIRIKKIHDLSALIEMGKELPELPKYLLTQKKLVSEITDYAIASRYPDAVGNLKPVTRAAVKKALDFAFKCFTDLSELANIHKNSLK